MPALVPSSANRSSEAAYATVERLELVDHPVLAATLWLYVDDIDRSHVIAQNIHTPLGSFLHGVIHRREGDFSNAKYWFRQAGGVSTGVDPFAFVDAVAAARGENPEALVEMQRQEWQALYEIATRD